MIRRKIRGIAVMGNFHHDIGGGDFHGVFIGEGDPGVERVKDLLALAAIGNHVVAPQQTEMVADGGLWKPQFFAKGRDVPFTPGQGQKDVQARFIG